MKKLSSLGHFSPATCEVEARALTKRNLLTGCNEFICVIICYLGNKYIITCYFGKQYIKINALKFVKCYNCESEIMKPI